MKSMPAEMLLLARRVSDAAATGGADPSARRTVAMSEDEYALLRAYADYRGIDHGQPVRRLAQELAHGLAEGRDILQARFFPTPTVGLQLLMQVASLGLVNKQLNGGLYPVKPGSRKTTSIASLQRYFEEGAAKRWSLQSGSANEKLVYRLHYIVQQVQSQTRARAEDTPAVDLDALVAKAIAAHP